MPWRTLLQAAPPGDWIERLISRLPTWIAIPVVIVIILATVGKPVLNWLRDVLTGIRESSTIKAELAILRKKVEECELERAELSDLRGRQETVILDFKKLLRGLLDSEDLTELKGVIRSFIDEDPN